MMMTAAKRNIYARWLPVVALLAAVPPYLMRQLWFDEALTVLNFAAPLESPADIYTSYVIPNNHILFTMVIHYWIELHPSCLPWDLWLRLPSLFFAAGLLFYLGGRFRRCCGALPLAVALTGMAISPPFLIYATAVRGYMLGALLVALALGSALNFCAAYRLRDLVIYELCVFGAVLTVPSDMAAVVGALLFVLPVLGRSFWKDWRFYLLVFAPVVAFLIAYLPIWSDFLKAARLGEGGQDRGASVVCVYLAVFAAFGVLPLLLFRRGARAWKHRDWHRLPRLLIWLLPIPAAWIFKAAPFPRVYFPLFPVLAVVVAAGLRDISLWNWKKRMPSRGMNHIVTLAIAMLSSFVLWAGLWRSQPVLSAVSQRFGGDLDNLGDDFFRHYYLRREHQPILASEALEKLKFKTVYFSFHADPWSIMFYHRGSADSYLFDGPRGIVPKLPDGAAVVLRRDEDPYPVALRFKKQLTQVAETPNCRIFVAEEPL